MSGRKSAAIFAAACLAAGSFASAATFTFQDGAGGYDGTQDLSIFIGSESDINTGGTETFYVGYSGKSLIRFDNLGSLVGQTIQSATLTLYSSLNSAGTLGQTDPVSIYQMEDANAGWQQGVGVYPNVASPGEACGGYRGYNTDPWPVTTVMQYYLTSDLLAPLDTQTFPYQVDGQPITFTLPVSLVQQWVSGTNPGLYVDSSVYANGIQFFSSESSTSAYRPLLTVETAPVPEPASMAMLGLLGLGCLSRRRRA